MRAHGIKAYRKMKAAIVSIALILSLACLVSSSSKTEWNLFKVKHGKKYSNVAEDAMRRAIFEATKQRVIEFNRHESKEAGFELGLNHMSDWTNEEKNKLFGYRKPHKPIEERKLSDKAQKYLDQLLSDSEDTPSEVDWRKVPGRISPVKNQGSCGSCWAFAAIGMLEGQEYQLNSTFTSLSAQEVVDCCFAANGCNGGFPYVALEWINYFGVTDEQTYPYVGLGSKCKEYHKIVEKENIAVWLPKGDIGAIKNTLSKYGPIAISLEAPVDWIDYRSGIFRSKFCQHSLNHAVLLVGYGTNEEGVEYWILKNSWGTDWGESGYMRIAMNLTECGVTDEPVIAILE